MTYYGRWTYKFEEGAGGARRASSSSTRPGRPDIRLRSCKATCGERFDLVTPDKNMGRASIEGWLSLDATKKLLAQAGHDFDALKKQALTRDFRPVPLEMQASLGIRNSMRTIQSQERAREARGHDMQLRDEYVVYTAHWDHLGKGEPSTATISTTARSTTRRA